MTPLAPEALSRGADPHSMPRVLVARRPPLPGGRAVIGGLLVAVAAVATFAASGAASGPPGDRYVVAAADVAPGAVVGPGDLTTVVVDLPAGQRAMAFTDLGRLVGTVALGELRAGQLVQSTDVAAVEGAGGLVQVSVPVEPANAMNGERRYLRGGERVDVVATVDRAGASATTTVVRDATVVEVLAPGGGIGSTSRLTVVLAVSPTEVEAVVGAAAGSTIALVRTTGLR